MENGVKAIIWMLSPFKSFQFLIKSFCHCWDGNLFKSSLEWDKYGKPIYLKKFKIIFPSPNIKAIFMLNSQSKIKVIKYYFVNKNKSKNSNNSWRNLWANLRKAIKLLESPSTIWRSTQINANNKLNCFKKTTQSESQKEIFNFNYENFEIWNI